MALSVEVLPSFLGIAPAEWDGLLGAPEVASPFLEWRFLASLEEAGTFGESHGWIPSVLTVRREGRLVAAAPAFIKLHSQGEFVFDFAWANFAHQAGVRYYPKLLVGVPFTPVSGRRLLTAPGEDRGALLALVGEALVEMARHFEASSVHVNFATEEETEALVAIGWFERIGLQYQYHRRTDQGFEDYLARFKSKRRNQVRRERRALAEQGLSLERVAGAEVTPALARTAFELYRATIDKFYWGRQYLNARVFELWAERMPDRLEMIVARDGSSRVVAGTVNFAGATRLYGRYWGAFAEHRHLHFNVCYYEAIEECCRRGLEAFEPGAGGEHKLVRGFEPTVTRSAHLMLDPELDEPIRRYVVHERLQIERESEAMRESMGYK